MKKYLIPQTETILIPSESIMTPGSIIDNNGEDGMIGEAPARVGFLGPAY